MATLYLSGGGLGRSAHAWPEALHWLAAQPGPLLLASIASDDDRQARTLQQLLATRPQVTTIELLRAVPSHRLILHVDALLELAAQWRRQLQQQQHHNQHILLGLEHHHHQKEIQIRSVSNVYAQYIL